MSTPTQYPDLFAALAARFAEGEVKLLDKAGRKMPYVTARTVMNRLDDVLGPENWHDHYQPLGESSVLCALTVRLPDGQLLTKCDAGGNAGMADAGDDDKSGFSDAFKRAAVKFGVGRYLYKDGVPGFVREALEGRPAPGNGHTPAPPAEDWRSYLRSLLGAWQKFEPLDPGDDKGEVSREHRIAQDLAGVMVQAKLIAEADLLKPAEAGKPPARDARKVFDAVKRVYTEHPDWVRIQCRSYLIRKRDEARTAQPAAAAPAREPGEDG